MSEGKTVTFADVVGYDDVKEELLILVKFLRDPKEITRLGGKVPRGTLLTGPRGVGKRLLVRAVAGEANRSCLIKEASSLIGTFEDGGSGRVKNLFDEAREEAPCVVCIDGFDNLSSISGGFLPEEIERSQIVNQFLDAMDGLPEDVILIATTTHSSTIDPLFLRLDRFGKEISVDLPNQACRRAILEFHARDKSFSKTIDFVKVARGTVGASGANLVDILNEAALRAASLEKQAIGEDDLDWSVDRFLHGYERKNLSVGGREVRAYHEVGHVLIALMSPASDPIEKVTIIPHAEDLGFTRQLPLTDHYAYSLEKVLTEIRIFMGGRAAEEVVFGRYGISTGAENDIEQATLLSCKMVCVWGMSSLGLVSYVGGSDDESGGSGSCSPRTQRKIDITIKKINSRAYREAKRILRRNETALHAIVRALLEKETLSGEEVREIINEHNR